MNNNLGGMNAMGGPVGGGMPMMNNGAPAGVRQQQPLAVNETQRSQLNTYIYEYFLKHEMYDCAKALLTSGEPMNVIKDSPGRRRDDNANSMGNGAGDDGAEDSKDDIDAKRPSDLPLPNLPKGCPESCFLYEWWSLFWDMFNARRGKGEQPQIIQYVAHTQHQSRMNQERQQAALRGLRGGEMLPQQYQMMMSRQNGMNMNPNELRHKVIANNTRNATPQQQQMQLLAQQQQQQQKQQQMQRDPSDGNNQQRPQSPGSAENAPSPSKRPRLDGAPFNQQQMPNGRVQGQGIPQQVGHTYPSVATQAAHLQLAIGTDRTNVATQQFQNMSSANANAQARSLTSYQATLAQQQANQMPVKNMPNQGGPQNQGSPMMSQGPDNGAIANYYNPGDMGPNGIRGGPGGQPGAGNHALQDYQMQLMLLEQQNKKRLMMARQEQDSMTARPDGSGPPGAMGPNGQPSFQGTSPQGARSVNSPNPAEQMKRGAQHMNPGGMPSPLPEGQSRGSPSGMNFNIPGGPMDANMAAAQFYKANGMDPNMVAAGMTNGMRPPMSHPAGFAAQMTPQQLSIQRQQQQSQQQMQNWQVGPNGQMMPQQPQAGAQQTMGTPQQRAMPPPSAPAAGTTVNGRTQPPSPQQAAAPPTPQQANKAAPKKKAEPKDSKAKRATKKGSAANLNSGATPSADANQEPATPTPATPITPVHPKSFNNNAGNGQNGVVQPVVNGQPSVAPNANMANAQPTDSLPGGFAIGDAMSFDLQSLEFGNPTMGDNVLQDFDFDSFLHQDEGGVDATGFDAFGFMDGNEIGAEGP